MKIAIFDVSNGNCALAVCPNGNSMMLDCGSHSEKTCPVELIKGLRLPGGWLSHMKNYRGIYPLTQLVVSHPDLDHIKNVQKVHKELTPGILARQYIEEFPHKVVHQDDDNYKYYKEKVCASYRQPVEVMPDWGFIQMQFSIPMNILRDKPEFGESKMKNNSSLVYLLDYNGFRILFCGDMEEVGWEWLIANDSNFVAEIKKGVDVIVASHHGHTSGYSQKLMDLIGAPKIAILSKGTETGCETDVDYRCSTKATGYAVTSLTDKRVEVKKILTTRTNGNIYFNVSATGVPVVFADNI